MDDLYQDELLDHYRHPHNYGDLSDSTCSVNEVNASCGDSLVLQLKVADVNGVSKVLDARFTGIGCVVSMAATSLLTDYIKNKSVAELKNIDFEFMQQLLGTTISPGRVKCLTLSPRALMQALAKSIEKVEIS